MTERQSREVAKVLLHISDAAMRSGRTAADLERDGAPVHLVNAIREAETRLNALHRSVSQGTYYAVAETARTSDANGS